MRISLIIFILFISSCSSKYYIKKSEELACTNYKQTYKTRIAELSKLSSEEILERNKTIIKTEELFLILEKTIKETKKDAEFINLDLREYNEAHIGNIIFANLPEDKIPSFLNYSKFRQETFILLNINKEKITLLTGNLAKPKSTKKTFNRKDLSNSELIIHLKNNKQATSNIKFTGNFKFSIIAENIEHLGLDVRAASNIQVYKNQKWFMKLFSLKNSNIKNGKYESGFINFINNKRLKEIKTEKFNDMEIKCYSSNKDLKFN